MTWTDADVDLDTTGRLQFSYGVSVDNNGGCGAGRGDILRGVLDRDEETLLHTDGLQ